MSEGKIIVIVAPSGSGKSTLIKRIKNEFHDLLESVSFTTRKAREGEEHGKHYNFISEEEFLAMKKQDAFLEWAKVHGNYYGTSKDFVENEIAQGHNLLFDLDVQGTDSFKEYFGDRARVIFIAPPSVEALEQRLRGRGTETDESLNIRLDNAKRELLRKNDYDYLVVNDDLETAYIELKDIFEGILRK
ncbi:guanylate kinase [Halobacteriovorax sp. XZX-3]|uniref:guanylate kinase n=1 Tax=unclassified Halobacteriovorax TaxID=2639665 RepID=UPI000CD087E2|nr:guanylate kinase [Halobacteriovorax sp. DA5]POB13882.1 guanylate kinase [Halobacteriovorax sp. DA5]